MASTKDVPEKLRPYIFYGVDLNVDEVQSQGECPFCGRRKLGIKTEDGQFRCVACETSGNIYTFIARLHSDALKATDPKTHLHDIAEERGLDAEVMHSLGICVSPLTGELLVPGYNREGKMSNLYKTYQSDGKWHVLAAPKPLKLTPFGINKLLEHPNVEKLHVTEGLWDWVAWYTALRSVRKAKGDTLIKTVDITRTLYKDTAVIGVPGSGNFDPAWFVYLEGRDVTLLYDNDHPKRFAADHAKAGELQPNPNDPSNTVRPGWDGMQRVCKLANSSKTPPAGLSCVFWNRADRLPEPIAKDSRSPISAVSQPGHHPELPDGFDLRDALLAGPALTIPWVLGLCDAVAISPKEKDDAPGVEPLPCESYDELVKHYRELLHFTPDMEATLAVMLSVVLSTEMPESQLWLRVIGPPGSGKTTLADAICAAREYVLPNSKLTGFHSGYVDYDAQGNRNENASLLFEFDGKTVVQKDGDTLLTSPQLAMIMGEMRDIYDGSASVRYRNKVKTEFSNLRMTYVLCGTRALRGMNRSQLGERFVDVEIMDQDADRRPFLQRASANMYASLVAHMKSKQVANGAAEDAGHLSESKSTLLKRYTCGYIHFLKNHFHTLKIPTIDRATDSAIHDIAEFVGYMRAKVEREGNDITYRPEVELATRLTQQLNKLPFCLALVLQRPSVDDRVMAIVRKVARDTANGFQLEVTNSLAKHPEGASVHQLCFDLNLPETNMRRLLPDMQEFKIVQRKVSPNNSGQRGRDRHLWQLTPYMRKLWDSTFPKNSQAKPTTKTAPTKPAQASKPLQSRSSVVVSRTSTRRSPVGKAKPRKR